MKTILLFLTLLLFTSCGSKKFYHLGSNLNIKSNVHYTKGIDVVKVTVPKYLKEHQVVRQVSDYQVELIKKAHWLHPMEKSLTHILIEYLQQSLNNPNVYLYPWDSNNKIRKRVSLDIKKFIASKNSVSLKANYKVMDLEDKTSQFKYFQTEVKSNDDIESMMEAKEEAYLKLLEDIKTTIINNK